MDKNTKTCYASVLQKKIVSQGMDDVYTYIYSQL